MIRQQFCSATAIHTTESKFVRLGYFELCHIGFIGVQYLRLHVHGCTEFAGVKSNFRIRELSNYICN